MQKIMPVLVAAMPDALIVAGGCALSYGAWLLHPAAGFAVGGILLIAGGLTASRNLTAKKVAE